MTDIYFRRNKDELVAGGNGFTEILRFTIMCKLWPTGTVQLLPKVDAYCFKICINIYTR